MRDEMKFSTRHLYVAFFLFSCAFFCFRIPFYQQKLVAEEGTTAYLLLHDVPKPNYLIISRVGGVDLMGAPQHPGLMYASMGAVGKLSRQVIDYSKLDEQQSAFVFRVIFSLPMLIMFLAGIFHVYKRRNENLYYWLMLFIVLVSSPVVLVTSTELHGDASFGIAIIGIWTFAILIVTDRCLTRYGIKALLFFIGTFIASLGKNEWSLVLLLTLLLVSAYLLIIRRRLAHWSGQLTIMACGFLGLLSGNLVSYLFDPLNYQMGLQLMLSMSAKESVVCDSKFAQLLGVTRHRWSFISQNILLLMTAATLCLRPMMKNRRIFDRVVLTVLPLAALYFTSLWTEYLRLEVLSLFIPIAVIAFSIVSSSRSLQRQDSHGPPDPLLLVPIVFSSLLFGAYFVSTWDGGPRYFCIALAISLFALLGLLKQHHHLLEKKIILNLTVSILVLNLFSYLNLESYNRIVPHVAGTANAEPINDCLRVMSSAEAVFKKVDFLGGACSKEYFEEMSRKYQKPLCR